MIIEKHQEHLLEIMDSMPDDACGDWRDSLVYAIDVIHKYSKLQSDYENRLRADLEVILDKIRDEFISLYPKNYAGEPELGGSSCEFSLNKVLKIIDKYIPESEDEDGY